MRMQNPPFANRGCRMCLTRYNGQLLTTAKKQRIQRNYLIEALGSNLLQICLHGPGMEERHKREMKDFNMLNDKL